MLIVLIEHCTSTRTHIKGKAVCTRIHYSCTIKTLLSDKKIVRELFQNSLVILESYYPSYTPKRTST